MGLLGYMASNTTVYNDTLPYAYRGLSNNIFTWGNKVFITIVPWAGYVEHEFILSNLMAELERLANETEGDLHELKVLNSLANIVLDTQIALDYVPASEGGVCVILNTTCCTYINNSAKVESRITEIFKHAYWLKHLKEIQLLSRRTNLPTFQV